MAQCQEEVDGWGLPWWSAGERIAPSEGRAMLAHAHEIMVDRDPTRICRFIRAAPGLHNAHGDVYRVVYMWRWALFTELCEVLEEAPDSLHASVYANAR